MDSRRGIVPAAALVALAVLCVFLGGAVVGGVVVRATSSGPSAGGDASLNEFLTAYHLVTQRSYYRPLDKRHLVYAAIDGMMAATGDPHTIFLPPQDNVVADHQLNGSQFSGIGAIVVPAHHALQIVTPLPKTPAARAGLQAGDMVTRINGRPVSSMPGDTAVARIHGKQGTLVYLTLVRAHRRPFTVAVKRAQIPPVTAYGRMLDHRLGDIVVLSFGDQTAQEVGEALHYLQAHHARGLILDLRGNPGGYVDAAQQIVSDFLGHGVVAYEESTNQKLAALPVLAHHRETRLPVAVLVDAGTASAAEITAGALRDNHRAVLIGTRTYGKGSMQSVYQLADGSSIRITDRMWLTPDKHSIQGKGIRPDITVAPGSQQGQNAADPQLAAGERYLLQHGAG